MSEHFLIEWTGEGPHPSEGYRGPAALQRAQREGALGLVAFHKRPVDGGWQLEQDVVFPLEEVRLMAVECLSATSPRLVWREITPDGGRTIFAEWTARSEELKSIEWRMDGSLRESVSTSRGAVMPQYLLELARTGRLVAGRFEVFAPLGGALETWTGAVSYLRANEEAEASDSTQEYTRRIEFRRDDGTLAGRYLFEGGELTSFQWQEGSIRARRIDPGSAADLRLRWGLDEVGRGVGDPDSAVKEL